MPNVILGFDLETIGDQNLPQGCVPDINSEMVPFGNTKDPVKRQAILDAKLPKMMGVKPSLCQICTFVGMFYDTDTDEVLDKVSIQVTKQYNGDDLKAVTEGVDCIRRAYNERTPIVSYNGIGFDMPVLWHRAMVQDVRFERALYDKLTPRYGSPHHYDLQGILAGWTMDKVKGHKLEFFLQKYGIGTKGSMDGSKVWPAWQAGEYDKIQEYCEADVFKHLPVVRQGSALGGNREKGNGRGII